MGLGQNGLFQLIQQRPGVLEVRGIETLDEPVVDREQEAMGLLDLALALPQPRTCLVRPTHDPIELTQPSSAQGVNGDGASTA